MPVISSVVRISIISIFFFSFMVYSQCSLAQEKKTVYIGFNYIKAKPGQGGVYEDLVKNYSTKILDFAVKSGAYAGWYFYSVRMPSGSASDYDYVAVSVVNDFKYLFEEPGTYSDIMKKAIPGISDQTLKSIAEQFEGSRILVRREILTRTSDLVPNAAKSKYARVDFNMTVEGREPEYLKMETELLVPIHKEVISRGAYTDWKLYKKFMPATASSDYNYVAIDFMNDISTLVNLNYAEIAKKVIPDSDWTLIRGSFSSRKLVRSEIWELLEAVESKK